MWKYRKIYSIVLMFVFMGSMANAQGYHHSYNEATACDKNGCYHPDPLGGWGLKPVRTYKLAYNGDDNVCPVIQKTLNDTIAKPNKNAKKGAVYPKHGGVAGGWDETTREGKGFYRSQNPLFSAPIFLQWSNFNWVDDQEIPPSLGAKGSSFFLRWQIVPFMNDGHPYLITERSESDYLKEDIAAPTIIGIWNVSPDELTKKDWSKPETYKDYEPIKDPENPAMKFQKLRELNSREIQLPKMAKEQQTIYSLWGRFFRYSTIIHFVHVNDRYYILMVDRNNNDLMIVVDASRPVGDDLCYLQSSISGSVKSPGQK